MRSTQPWCRRLRGLALSLAAAVLGTGVASADAGLHGDYFDAKTPPALGTPGDFVRTDRTVDFDWSGDAPDGTTIAADDRYSVRWTGFVRVDAGGPWTFKTVSNDGVRLWVDNTAVVDAWDQHAAQLDEGVVSLPGAGWYPIRLEHFNDGGTATIELRFEGPGQADVVIPSTHLETEYPGGQPPVANAGGVQVTPLGSGFALDGEVTGGTGGVVALWTQVAGPTATIVSPNDPSTQVVPSATGLHTFQLTANDPVGGFASDVVDVYVTDPATTGTVSGTLRKWHPVTVDFVHDTPLDETSTPNPFTDLRLQVHFVHEGSNTVHVVPGYFAGDGDAANSRATGGRVWRARFAPDFPGEWHYVAFFQSGSDVAIALTHLAGSPVSFDGAAGTLDVEAVDPTAPGFLKEGRLDYVGGHHRRFAQTGRPFLKTGTDSPENLLGYYEFDNTFDLGGQTNDLQTDGYRDGLHHFDPHLADYDALGGGPTWQQGKGKRLVGALNYLASAGVNSIYFLTYNIDGGDGQEVHPWATPQDKLRFDLGKLDQWGLVFEHAQELGILLHVVLQEVENEAVLDGGALGRERKLYYREMVARFGHVLALTWNIGEEYGGSSANLQAYADHLRALDPWSHPIKVHTHPDQIDDVYQPIFGDAEFEGASLQMAARDTVWRTQQLRDDSADAGQPWVVEYDEQNPAGVGLLPDAVDPDHDDLRRDALWGNLLAGGGGVEWYFGYGYDHDDLDCEDFRSRANMWDQASAARELLEQHLPFERMEPLDGLAGANDAQVLALRGEHYAVLRPNGGATTLDLEGSTDTFTVDWFDGKRGGALQQGSVRTVTGPGVRSLGTPPAGGLDWVALVRRADNRPPFVSAVAAEPTPFVGGRDLTIGAAVGDPDGPSDVARVVAHVWDPSLAYLGSADLDAVGGGTHALRFPDLPALKPGTWWLLVLAVDTSGRVSWNLGSFQAR